MTSTSTIATAALAGAGQFRPHITVFHCVSAIGEIAVDSNGNAEIQSIKMPCSIATREVFLLRAFEAGADAVVVLVCPEGQCRHLQGNTRAAKRVARTKKLLDEVGLDGRRLSLHNIARGDGAAVARIIAQTGSDLAGLGPNPARRPDAGRMGL